VTFFATAAKGTEGAVRDELRERRFRGVRATRGGVSFDGPLTEGFRACLELRTAVRVLWELTRFPAPSGEALYEGVNPLPWDEHISTRTTIAVRATCRSSALTHSQFIALKTKDAIVDRLRDVLGARPDVDADDPDALIVVHLVNDEATLYLDLGGRPLHLRGYRTEAGEAPLKESLAACLVGLSGWDRTSDFLDPMCGSGTIAIEAAARAAHLAPGLAGDPFGFTRWASFDDGARAAWTAQLERARAAVRPPAELPIVRASDRDSVAVANTERNAARAGVRVRVERASLESLANPGAAWVVFNPPYGERLDLPEAEALAAGSALAKM
jgi:23S rRNA G2445 N2-methylase RlmL